MLKAKKSENKSEESSEDEDISETHGSYDSDNNTFKWKISETDKEILSVLTGKKHLLNIKQPKKVIGNCNYIQHRHILHDDEYYQLVFPDTNITSVDNTKKQNKKIKKSEQIQTENSLKMVNSFFDLVLKYIGLCKCANSIIIPTELLQHEYLEINGIGFLIMLYHIKTNTHLYLSEDKIKPECLSLVVNIMLSVKKFINDTRELVLTNIIPNKLDKISEVLISDLQKSLNDANLLYVVSGSNIVKHCQDLLTAKGFNYFDNNISPLDHQLKLAKKVEEHFNSGFFIVLNSVIGSGKTMGIFGLIDIVVEKKLKSHPGLEILYVCNSESIRRQFINLCECADLKFGEFKSGKYTYVDRKGNLVTEQRHSMHDYHTCQIHTRELINKRDIRKLTNVKTNRCVDDKTIVSDKYLTVTNLTGAIELLTHCNSDKYIVCFDEPNDEADNINSFALKNSMKIISLFTKRSILISGTIPNTSSITPIINKIKSKYDKIHVDTVNTQEITTGCLVLNYLTGEVFLPYYGSDTKEKIINIINNLQLSPFLSRFCENNVFYHLYNLMRKENINEISYLDDYFNNFDNLTSDKIKSSCINLLEILSSYDNDIIEKVCSQRLFLNPLNIGNLGTTGAHQLVNGQTIIASASPVNTTLDMFSDLLADINNHTFVVHTMESLKANINDHQILLYGLDYENNNTEEYFNNIEYDDTSEEEKETENNNLQTDSFSQIIQTQNLNKINALDKSKSTTHMYKNFTHMQKIFTKYAKYYAKIEYDGKLFNVCQSLPTNLNVVDKFGIRKNIILTEHIKPKLYFGDEFQINSITHQIKYTDMIKSTGRPLHNFYNEEISRTRVNDDLISLLLAGIGIYDPNDKRLDKSYLDLVLCSMLQGNLSYVISNRNICYGISMPVYNILALDDFVQQSSIHDIGQLSGRAGRRNKSTSATMYLGNIGFNRYLSYANNMQESDQLVSNMLEVFESV